MSTLKLTATEKIILSLVAIILLIGFILFYTNLPAFVVYVEEDGIVEWLTVLGLILAFAVCVGRFFRLRKTRSWWFLTVTIGLAFLLFAAAGEEISWGQRILGIKSSAFFEKNNSQHETNFHNLIVDGVKVNKVVFSFGLIGAMGIYLLIFPVAYRYKEGFRKFVDRSGIPLPRLYQVISILLLFVITEMLHHEKRAEMLEAGITLLFFLIVRYPANAAVFNKNNLPVDTPK
jgi:hypothetical protein